MQINVVYGEREGGRGSERGGVRGGQSARPNTETHVSGVSWHSHRITKRFRALISYNEHKYVEHGDNRSCTARPTPTPTPTRSAYAMAADLSRVVQTCRYCQDIYFSTYR